MRNREREFSTLPPLFARPHCQLPEDGPLFQDQLLPTLVLDTAEPTENAKEVSLSRINEASRAKMLSLADSERKIPLPLFGFPVGPVDYTLRHCCVL